MHIYVTMLQVWTNLLFPGLNFQVRAQQIAHGRASHRGKAVNPVQNTVQQRSMDRAVHFRCSEKLGLSFSGQKCFTLLSRPAVATQDMAQRHFGSSFGADYSLGASCCIPDSEFVCLPYRAIEHCSIIAADHWAHLSGPAFSRQGIQAFVCCAQLCLPAPERHPHPWI